MKELKHALAISVVVVTGNREVDYTVAWTDGTRISDEALAELQALKDVPSVLELIGKRMKESLK